MNKIVYIAHPIGGDVKENLEKVRIIVRAMNLLHPSIVPFAPYWVDCHALDDDNPIERARGIANDEVWFDRKIIDELWLFGNRISSGMLGEINKAIKNNIPILAMSKETKEEFEALIKEKELVIS